MATIRDVAARAGVSHGTVTNVLKCSRNVSPDKVKRVMKAVEELGYTPQVMARSLKSSSMNAVGIILPNTTDSFYSQFYSAAEATLSTAGLHVMLFTTNNVVEKEKQCVLVAESLCLQGIVMITCQPENTMLFKKIMEKMKLVLVEREVNNLDCNYIAINNKKSIHYAVSTLISQGHYPVAIISGQEKYSSERECLEGYRRAITEKGLPVSDDYIWQVDETNESAFQATAQLLQLPEQPKSIVCTSTQYADGAIGAMRWANTKVEMVSLGENNWNDNRFSGVRIIPRYSLKLGEEAANILLENIKNPVFFDKKRVFLDNKHVDFELEKTERKRKSETIKVMLQKGVCSKMAFDAMLPSFEEESGIKVEIEEYEFTPLYYNIKSAAQSDDTDIFVFDISWLTDFASNNVLYNLTDLIDSSGVDINTLVPKHMQKYLMFNDKIFALLHRFSGQLLFYRKDLFEDIAIKTQFYNQYGSELKAPKSWTELNAIAKFFTKKYNPDSPTTYGLTMGSANKSAVLCDFLPRLWALGGDVFDKKGKLTLDSMEATKALDNYIESAKYCSAEMVNYGWAEDAQEFACGDVAMIIEFPERTSCFADLSSSPIAGKVGFDHIPGNCTAIGGWLFGINAKSQKTSSAFEFIKWASSEESYMPITVLEGLPATLELYSSVQLQTIYPWHKEAIECIKNSKERTLSRYARYCSIMEYEEIISNAIHEAVVGNISSGEALKQATKHIRELIKQGASSDCAQSPTEERTRCGGTK